MLLPLTGYVFWGRSKQVIIPPLNKDEATLRFLSLSLWLAQVFVAFVFLSAGFFKLLAPTAEVAQSIKFAADYSPLFVKMIGLVDIMGGIGILLPSLTRILPRTVVWAALGCLLLQVLAIIFHFTRSEWSGLPLNFALLTAAAYVFWGRSHALPVLALDNKRAINRFFVISIWTAQTVLCFILVGAGLFKLSAPIAELAKSMAWTGDYSPAFVRFLGMVDLAGGLGILLPALTRVLPKLTLLAALGCVVLQVLAIVLHISRGEYSVLTLNFILLPLAVYVLYARGWLAPVPERE
jgi:DoxX-like family